jgi:hypothetical protein
VSRSFAFGLSLIIALACGFAHADEPAADGGAPEAPPWPKQAKSVLLLGDSTVGTKAFGLSRELDKRFQPLGVKFHFHVETAAGLRTFATSKKTEQLMRDVNPDVVLLGLGTNNLSTPNSAAYEAHVKSIVAQVGGRPCYWIGPLSIAKAVAKQTTPDTPKDPDAVGKAMVAMLKKNSAPCRYFDSYALQIPREPDDIHATFMGAGKWAEKIWAFLQPTAPTP